MNTCDTCKWWGTEEKGECDFVNTIHADIPATEFTVNANASDDTGLVAWLTTGPKFGCIHHKRIPTRKIPQETITKKREAKMRHKSYVTTASGLRNLLERQPKIADTITTGWWVVRWPDHVKIARFDGNANYSGPFSRDGAILLAGECDVEG